MAITIDDFSKIWASTSPLTPYEFSENNYKQGWNFIGGTPPSRQMWDAFMKNADEKLKYLYNHEDVPVGFEYFTMNPNIPQGSLPLLGGEYSRETYSALWSWVQEQTGYLKTEAEWQTLSTANNGNVPFYSSGDGSTTFRVPSLHCWIKGSDGSAQLVGSYLEAGLPNITGYINNGDSWNPPNAYGNGAFAASDEGNSSFSRTVNQGNGGWNFDASRSNSIYGNANTVQPESIVGMWLVKAYGTIVDTGQIDEQAYIDDRYNAMKTYVDGKFDSVVAKDTDYIRYDSGLQMCFGVGSVTTNQSGTTAYPHLGYTTITFPVPFNAVPFVNVDINDNPAYWNVSAYDITTTDFSLYAAGDREDTKSVPWFAIGWWK